jgi:TonB family protein
MIQGFSFCGGGLMSAAPSRVFQTPQRGFSRHPINVPLDLIALRSGVPENLPGRCTDISEVGLGAVVAGELSTGQQVAIELRLPNVGLPVRARALVRYQSQLRCGLEFVGMSVEQREMIRYWVYRSASEISNSGDLREGEKTGPAKTETSADAGEPVVKPRRRVRMGRRGVYLLIASLLLLAGLGWWQWQRSWSELEKSAPERGLRVSPETMDKRIVTKVDPVYPEAARSAGTQGLVVLDAVIAPDGSVTRLRTISGPEPLVRSAKDAVQSWKFEPYLYGGKAIEVQTTIAVDFRLN